MPTSGNDENDGVIDVDIRYVHRWPNFRIVGGARKISKNLISVVVIVAVMCLKPFVIAVGRHIFAKYL